jgi:hypothetical protein
LPHRKTKPQLGPKATLRQRLFIKKMYQNAHTTPNIKRAMKDKYVRELTKGKELTLQRIKQIILHIKSTNPTIQIKVFNKKLERLVRKRILINELRASKLHLIRKHHITQKSRIAGFLYRYTPITTKEGMKARREYRKLFPKEERY